MKSQEPLVSVIVPTYNRAAIVPRALQSIINQTYQNLEVIVVDDASSDNTQEVITGFHDPRIRYLRHDRNRGGSVARNTGIHAAHGEYLAFLDSDDEWLSEKLAIQIAEMLKTKALFCYCQSYRQQPDGSYVVMPREPFSVGSLLAYLSGSDSGIGTPAVVVQRGAAVLFDETLSIYQDWDWILQFRRKTTTDQWVFIPKPLCYFHTDVHVRTQTYQHVPLIERVRTFMNKYADELDQAPLVRRQLVWGCACNALIHGNRRLARSLLLEYRLFPSLWCKPRACLLWLKCLWPS